MLTVLGYCLIVTVDGVCLCMYMMMYRNEIKFYIREEVHKSCIMMYGYENELDEYDSYISYYNDLYMMSEMRIDTEMITKIGIHNRCTSYYNNMNIDITDDTISVLNDGLMLSNASSFYRKKNVYNIRDTVNKCISYPLLNNYTYCMDVRTLDSSDIYLYDNIVQCMYDHTKYMTERYNIKYSMIDNGGDTYNRLYSPIDNSEIMKRHKSISEIYSLHTYRKEYSDIPTIDSMKIHISAIEGISLNTGDITGLNSDDKTSICSIDVQGCLMYNTHQMDYIYNNILGHTIQKGYNDSKINIDVDKYTVEEYRDNLMSISELNGQVMKE